MLSFTCTFIVVVLNIRFALNNTSASPHLHLSCSVMGAAVEILKLLVWRSARTHVTNMSADTPCLHLLKAKWLRYAPPANTSQNIVWSTYCTSVRRLILAVPSTYSYLTPLTGDRHLICTSQAWLQHLPIWRAADSSLNVKSTACICTEHQNGPVQPNAI